MTEYKLVPIEPTQEMWLAGIKHQQEYKASYTVESTYKAMLFAAPPIQPIDVEKLKREVMQAVTFDSIAGGVLNKPNTHDILIGFERTFNYLAAHYNITKKGE